MDYRKVIDNHGLKHTFIANYIGVSKSMFSLFLKGERNLSPEKLMKLHKVLGLHKSIKFK